MARIPRDHPRQQRARHVEEALDVRVDHVVPVVVLPLLHGVQAAGQAGVVDQDVDGHALAFQPVRESDHAGAVSNVEDAGTDLGAAAPRDVRRHGLQPVTPAADQDGVHTRVGQAPGGRFADTGRGPRHDCGLSSDSVHERFWCGLPGR